jgi:hypothetical protein
MPRERLAVNEGLPERWVFKDNAYYYIVPKGQEALWGFRQWFRLGKTIDESQKAWDAQVEAMAVDGAYSLKPHDAIVAKATQTPRNGVYFLIDKGEIVYVGKSDHLLTRVAAHQSGEMDFDAVSYIAAEGVEQYRLEQLYIAKFKPKHNISSLKLVVPDGSN